MKQETIQLFEERDKHNNEEHWEEVRKLTNIIRKQIRKDKKEFLKHNLEEQLWYDIKKAKAGFLPNHTKLKYSTGILIKSTDRPNTLG